MITENKKKIKSADLRLIRKKSHIKRIQEKLMEAIKEETEMCRDNNKLKRLEDKFKDAIN